MVGRRTEPEAARREPDERAAWMAAAQQGDAAAYETLLRSILPVLRAFVARRGVDSSEVEDVVQEILLLIHRARHTWRSDRPFDPWMWAIARNASTDALRRQGRERSRRATAQDVFGERAPLPADGSASPEEQIGAAQIGPGLLDALAKLPATQRSAVELLYVEQLSVAEAAARAGVSPSALKVRAHRGTRALRGLLGSKDGR